MKNFKVACVLICVIFQLAIGIVSGKNPNIPADINRKKNRVAVDIISGDSSKINQREIRQYMRRKLEDTGFVAVITNSAEEIKNGKFDYIMRVEIKKLKQTVSGNETVNEVELTVTFYHSDNSGIFGQQSAWERVAGVIDDGVRVAFATALGGLLNKIR